MPSAEDLDRITYKTIAIAFPVLTLMIAAGAYWANRAWGSYWNWDPKETWPPLITVKVYRRQCQPGCPPCLPVRASRT